MDSCLDNAGLKNALTINMSEALALHLQSLPEAECTCLVDLEFELWILAITCIDNVLNGQKRQMREVTEDLFNKCPHLEEDCQCYISSFLLYMLDIPFSFLLYYLHALFHRHMLYSFISFPLQHVVDFFISYM